MKKRKIILIAIPLALAIIFHIKTVQADPFPNNFSYDTTFEIKSTEPTDGQGYPAVQIQLSDFNLGTPKKLVLKFDTSTTQAGAKGGFGYIWWSTTNDISNATTSADYQLFCENNGGTFSIFSGATITGVTPTACKKFGDDGTELHLYHSSDGGTTSSTWPWFENANYFYFIRQQQQLTVTSTYLGTVSLEYGGTKKGSSTYPFTPYMDWGGASRNPYFGDPSLIQFKYPKTGEKYFWDEQYQLFYTVTDANNGKTGIIKVEYCQVAGLFSQTIDDCTSTVTDSKTLTLSNTSNTVFLDSSIRASTTTITFWTAQAHIISATGTLIDSSQNITFGLYAEVDYDAVKTETCADSSWFSSSTIPTVMCHVRNFFKDMFFPTREDWDKLGEEIKGFQTIPPFSFYFQIVGGTRDIIDLANTSTTDSIDLNITGLYGENIELVSLDQDTLKTAFTRPTSTLAFGGTMQGCDSNCADARINNLAWPVRMGIWIMTGIGIVGIVVGAL